KIAAILEAEGAIEDSYDYKAIIAVFDSIPRVELLAASADELAGEIKAIMAAEGGEDVRVLQRSDALGRGVFVVVILPRTRFSEELYRRIGARLAHALAAVTILEQRAALDDSDQARLHFYFATPAERVSGVATEELRHHVAALLRTWDDRLLDALREQMPRDRVQEVLARYHASFSNQYKAATDVAAAVRDIQCLEALVATRAPQVDLH